jgi:hypothetical protein
MNPFAKSTPLLCTQRFLVAGLCSIGLCPLQVAISGGTVDDACKALALGAWSGTAVAFLLPVSVRGDWVQRIFAAVLIAFPLLNLFGACFMALKLLAGLR